MAPTEPNIEPSVPRVPALAAPSSDGNTDRMQPGILDQRLLSIEAGSFLDYVERTLPAQRSLDSVVVARKAGVQIGPLYISLPTCDRFLGCELEFQRGSELAEAFNRYKEIEEQGALEDLYRKRLEAMRVKRKRRR